MAVAHFFSTPGVHNQNKTENKNGGINGEYIEKAKGEKMTTHSLILVRNPRTSVA